MTPTPLDEFATGLWVAEGPVVSFYGFPYPTRMAVTRLADGGVFVWSPIALTAELKPGSMSLVRSGSWSPRTSCIIFSSANGKKPTRRRCSLRHPACAEAEGPSFDADLADAPDPAWAADVDQVIMHGSPFLTEVVFFHRASRTAIFTDLIQNFPRDWFPGWRGLVARLDGIVAPHPGAPREWRASSSSTAGRRRRRSSASSPGRSSAC